MGLAAAWLALFVRRNLRRRKESKGKPGACGAGCAGCAYARNCGDKRA